MGHVWRISISACIAVAATALLAATPIQQSPDAVNQWQPRAAERQTIPAEQTNEHQSIAKLPTGAAPSQPLYVRAACEHGCGYSESDKGWWQKFLTDPNATFAAVIAMFTLALVIVSNRQARLTKDALITTSRAFIFLEDIEQTFAEGFRTAHSAAEVRDLTILPRWRNSGDTPPRDLVIQINSGLIRGDIPSEFAYSYAREPEQMMIGPKSQDWSSPISISDANAGEALSGQSHIYVWGKASYKDIFDGTPSRFTEFCLRARFHTTGREIRIQWVSYGDHNRSDADDRIGRRSIRLFRHLFA